MVDRSADAFEQELGKKAFEWVKSHKSTLINRFADDKAYGQDEHPISVFMAGSPGAGKTEFSKMLVRDIFADLPVESVVRIDPDEIREMIPGYEGDNAHLFQKATDRAVHDLHSHCLYKGKSFILDGTFHNYARAEENISRSLKRGRAIIIFYIYLSPHVAWDVTQKREEVEGRRIRKEDFITKLFSSRKTAEEVKRKFKSDIQVWAVQKHSIDTYDFELWKNVDTLDGYINIPYSKKQLEREL